MAKKIYRIDKLTKICGYFYDAREEKGVGCNNGYNCNHPEQEEVYKENGVEFGCCFAWSCPIGYEPDEEDFKNPDIDNDFDTYEELEFVVVEEVFLVEKDNKAIVTIKFEDAKINLEMVTENDEDVTDEQFSSIESIGINDLPVTIGDFTLKSEIWTQDDIDSSGEFEGW